MTLTKRSIVAYVREHLDAPRLLARYAEVTGGWVFSCRVRVRSDAESWRDRLDPIVAPDLSDKLSYANDEPSQCVTLTVAYGKDFSWDVTLRVGALPRQVDEVVLGYVELAMPSAEDVLSGCAPPDKCGAWSREVTIDRRWREDVMWARLQRSEGEWDIVSDDDVTPFVATVEMRIDGQHQSTIKVHTNSQPSTTATVLTWPRPRGDC